MDIGGFASIRRFNSTILTELFQELSRVSIIDEGNNGLDSISRVKFDWIIQQLFNLPFIIP